MFGWRARIGMLIPTNNTVIEPEMAFLAPEGVTFHATRMVSSRSGHASVDGLHHLVSCVDRAAEELSITGVDAFLYGCLSTSLAVEDWDREFLRKIAGWSDRPAITAFSATCAALKALGVAETAVLCPYGPELQVLIPAAFAAQGIRASALQSLQVTGLQAVCRVPEGEVYRAGRALAAESGAGCLCILATDLTTLPVLAKLEQDLGIPVVSTNQALAWAAQSLTGVREASPAGGVLFGHAFKQSR